MKKLCILLLLLLTGTGILFAQEIEKSVKERLSNYFETYIPASANTGSSKLKSVDIDFEEKKNYPSMLPKVLLISPFYRKQ